MFPGVSSRRGSGTQDPTKSFYQRLRNTTPNSIDDIDDHDNNVANVSDASRLLVVGDGRTTERDETAGSCSGDIDNSTTSATHAPRGMNPRKWQAQDEEADNDVPESLLVEVQRPKSSPHVLMRDPISQGAGPYNTRRQSQAHPQHGKGAGKNIPKAVPQTKPMESHLRSKIAVSSAREQALWRWANVTNLDVFMKDAYEYYLGSGFWCILCERMLHLLQSAFVAVFLTFLTQCVDYASIHPKGVLSDTIKPQCTKYMPWYWNLGLWLFVFYFIWKAVQFSIDTRRLVVMRDFYTHLLDIPEQDMQTVSWQDIVSRVMALRDANPHTATNMTPSQRKWLQAHSKERLDAIDIASRIMRKDNYLIALINKDVLDLSLPIPFVDRRQFFSGTLQWWLYFSIIDLVFDQNGQVNQQFLKASSRRLLTRKLHDRFVVAGLLNLLGSPFWVCYQVLIHLLSYYNEFKKDSGTLGDRRYTALAKWKFREFNELPHFFQERINMSYPFASRYVDQFPKRLVEQVAHAVTFMSGAVTFVLATASFLEPDIVLTFQITKDRPALFYIGVFGTIWAVARGMVSEDTTVFNPEFALRRVTDFTHYIPDHWRGRLHSFDVKKEFSELYKLKVVILAEEIIGIFMASFILMYSIPKSSERIVDFFREFTIHVDGLGYVCSFAEFEFRQDGATAKQSPDNMEDVRGDYYSAKHGKMAASYYGFLESYGHDPRAGVTGSHLPRSLRRQLNPRSTFHQGRFARVPPPEPGLPSHSPMTSVLLDPHHQPRMTIAESHNILGSRTRSLDDEFAKRSIIGESRIHVDDQDDEPYGGSGPLGGSLWQTSPIRKTMPRGDSEITISGKDHGVLGLIYQFQQVNRDNRIGGG